MRELKLVNFDAVTKLFENLRVDVISGYFLLPNDALHVATMKRYGITNIATKHFLSTRKISPYWACGVVGQSPTLC